MEVHDAGSCQSGKNLRKTSSGARYLVLAQLICNTDDVCITLAISLDWWRALTENFGAFCQLHS